MHARLASSSFLVSTMSDADLDVQPIKKPRPARKQVEVDQIDRSEGPQAGKEYNIWYNKWAGGDREDAYNNKVHSQSRCIIMRDAGYTRADAMGVKFCCLFFARGCCPLGRECKFLHRLPLASHKVPNNSMDCFGRERHADYRDDMGGVGSFNRQNRTLYVGKIRESADKHQTEETIRRHFGEWGHIVKMNILHGRGVAFVTYDQEHHAEFAKEAMANQSMDGDEILNVRWASEDPNPDQKVAEKRRVEEMGAEAIAGKVNESVVEAEQAVRALEEGDVEDFYPIEAPPSPEAAPEPAAKRVKTGLLDPEALDNLRYYAEVARKQAEAERKAKGVAPVGVQSLLGGYGSGDESD